METAEVVVIGGGVMGASIAWHLRELGVSDVVLLERESLASGSTSKSAGGFRTQFADELNVRIALRSLDELERMDGIDFRQDCAATGIAVRGGRVEAVETTRGRIATGTVVCAAGAWSAEVGALAGVGIPVAGERRWMHYTPQDAG